MEFLQFDQWSLPVSVLIFATAGAAIAFAGIKLSSLADRLADLTGMGEALMGGLFLGASTSLSGITASVTAAVRGNASLSLSNAIGGIAAQMVMLVIADFSYRRINLEHAAASLENTMQGTLQTILLAILLFAMVGPNIAFGGIHVITPILLFSYIFGMKQITRSMKLPMWRPRLTRETREDVPEEAPRRDASTAQIWLRFIFFAAITMVAGWLLTGAAESIAAQTALSDSIMGGFFVAVTTSTAELVTALAAVRRGALTLAVGDILGGNAFDCLFAAVADLFYREGSIYHATTFRELSLLALTNIMSGVLLLGLMAREKRGVARIGFESASVLFIYILGIYMLTVPGNG